jgi:hypothetical protein
MNLLVSRLLYSGQNIFFSIFGRLVRRGAIGRRAIGKASGVAVCLRFRDEARFLAEWVEYYQAAGVSHFFLYNNYSEDNYREVLQPFIDAGLVTLIEWPRTPASPAANEDFILRCQGRYEWAAVLDADEFVVIRDGSSIGDFLSRYNKYPAVALYWRYFGSNGHKKRPEGPVIAAYTACSDTMDVHVKCFVRPDRVTQSRNPHSWYYRGGFSGAVDEHGRPVYGSLGTPTGDFAWINHYHSKSKEDYLEKAACQRTADRTGMLYPSRRPEWAARDTSGNNDLQDDCALRYYRARRAAMERSWNLCGTK